MKYPHVQSGEKYARDVISGKIPACKWVRLACERHFRDKKQKTWRWKWSPVQVERKCRFMELFPHTKGKWASKNEAFVLQPFQCFAIMSIYGWVDKKNPSIYRFTRAMWLLPRKNGKSEIAARIGLDKFANDEEFGAEVFSGATSEKQAWEVFGPAHKMASRTPAFLEHYGVQAMKSNLHIPRNGSKFEPLIGNPGDGASPSCAIIDEYHEHLNNSLFHTMETGMGARERPLSLVITTAGDNLSGPCYALQKDLEKILEGTDENERFWGCIYTIDEGDDPFAASSLPKANPNYDVSVSSDFLIAKQREARKNSREQGIFQTKHLNVWVGARQAFFNIQSWIHECTREGITPQDYKGHRLFLGVDLASTKDIAAVVLLFELEEGRYATFGRFYIPEAAIENGANEHYAAWARDGHVIVCDGDMIDYNLIERDILDLHTEFGITELAFDPAYAQQLMQRLGMEGLNCVQIRPSVLNFTAPMKHFDGLILSGKIEHDGNPAFTWQMSNVVSKTDNKDNVYPVKERADAKIDGAVALIMAGNRAMGHVEQSVEVGALWT